MFSGPISAMASSHAASQSACSCVGAAAAAAPLRPSRSAACALPAARMGPVWLKLQLLVIASSALPLMW